MTSSKPTISLDKPLPSKTACLACRSRHQKCDAGSPSCSRCKLCGLSCQYEPSGRGKVFKHLHGKRKRSHDGLDEDFQKHQHAHDGHTHPLTCPTQSMDTALSIASSTPDLFAVTDFNIPSVALMGSLPKLVVPTIPFLPEFYASFWPSHPFLPPLSFVQDHLQQENGGLIAEIMSHIGLAYGLEEEGNSSKASVPPLPTCAVNGLAVQVYLLYAITYHMSGQALHAMNALSLATQTALSIDLHRQSFALLEGFGNPTGEESWRRTWWELYTLDILLAALNQKRRLLQDVESDVPLPCEEEAYRRGYPSQPHSILADFELHALGPEGRTYSSFTYRIAAARVLEKVINVPKQSSHDCQMLYNDADLTREILLGKLPRSMKTVFNEEDGAIDSMVFQTHMLIQAATILLHRPRSALNTFDQPASITCAPSAFEVSDIKIYHTKRCIDAANKLSELAMIAAPLPNQTPFFTCALGLQSLVHLGAYKLPQWKQKQSLIVQQVHMSLGALKALGSSWQTSLIMREQILDIARVVLRPEIERAAESRKPSVSPPTLGTAPARPTTFEDPDSGQQPLADNWFEEFLHETTAG